MTTTTLHAITKPIILAAIALVAPLASNAQAVEAGFTLKDQPGEYLDVLGGGKIVGRYMYAYDKSKLEQTYKPYLHVFDAEGKGPITKGPGGVFPHHRGIFIGWNKIHVDDKMYDRWHMKGGAQIHQKFLTQKADAKSAVIASRVDWMDDASKPFLEEERTMTFLPPPAPAHAFIDITFRLKAVAGEIKLEGDSQHAGVQYRPANELIKQETVYVYPKENASPDKDRDYPWVGETYTLNGKRYSVVYLNHPANPKETVFSATRDYGRFGAYFKTTIAKGGEQVIRTAFLISEGEMPPSEWIQKNYNQFAGTSDPAPKVTVRKIEPPKPKATPARFASAQLPSDVPWDVKALEKAPAFEWLDQKEKLQSLTYEAEPYQGHKTRVFAYYATPYTLGIDKEPGKKYPGVIVAHGGMGGAYGGWVEALAKRGYAAIAPCLNGGDKHVPESERGPKDSDDHTIFFPKEEPAIKDYWQYHAVADIILAHSLIRSFPDVDAERTGLWGISWGGFSTGIVSGLDHRFKAMVPMYGCGFYHENGQWAYKFKSAPPDKAKRWVELWDPSSYVGKATAPMMFINGAKDSFYPLDSYAKTYALVKAPKNISVQPALHHAHIYNQTEATLFLDQHLQGGVPLPVISAAAVRDGKVNAEIETKTKIKAVQLHWTTGPHKENSKRTWESKDLTLDGNKISGDAPPADATVWLITAQDERGALVSTPPMLQ